MKIKHQLSIATLLMAGVFVTGCSQQQVAGGSQQSAGGSQVAGGSQQSAGGSQVAGGSQQSSSQQQVEDAAPVVAAPVMAPKPTMAPKPNRWAHSHPAVPSCTNSVTHTHKYNQANHSHKYSCQGMAPKPQVDVRALQAKLKAKGYYKGPIDGIVGPGTRSALQRFMKR
ncbi:MAG: peptidoglycan-binding domain-containing protein [Cocleimonas sp.]